MANSVGPQLWRPRRGIKHRRGGDPRGAALGGLPSGATLGQERHFPGRARDLVLMVGRCTMQGAGLEAPRGVCI